MESDHFQTFHLFLPRLRGEDTMSWSIIITMGNRQKQLAKAMEEAGYAVFLPLKRTWRGKYATHAEITRPVFPGYLFAVLEPHEVHAFRSEGAIRMLRAFECEQREIDRCIEGWTADMAAGLFDDPKPVEKTAAIKPRNRRTRRAKRAAVSWSEGLKTVLDTMSECDTLAA